MDIESGIKLKIVERWVKWLVLLSGFLMGGAGNQLFQLARAHSHISLGRHAELVELGKYKKIIYKIIGFTYHKDWIDLTDISSSLGISIRHVTIKELFFLGVYFISRKIGLGVFDKELVKASKSILDVGYFQSPRHVCMESIHIVGKALSDVLNIRSNPSEFVVHVRGGDFAFSDRIDDIQARAISRFCIR